MTSPAVGMTVQDKNLGHRYLGTIVKVSADQRDVHVRWHGCVFTEEWPIASLNILS